VIAGRTKVLAVENDQHRGLIHDLCLVFSILDHFNSWALGLNISPHDDILELERNPPHFKVLLERDSTSPEYIGNG
jgi:hypothetical protein